MNIKIKHMVSHREWDEAYLTPEQFIRFDNLYYSKDYGEDGLSERYELSPTFIFEKGYVCVDESWSVDEDGHVSTSSYQCGVMSYSSKKGQYVESVYGREKELGDLVSVEFTINDGIQEALNKLIGIAS